MAVILFLSAFSSFDIQGQPAVNVLVQPVLELREDVPRYDLTPYLEVFEDRSGASTLADILSAQDTLFRPVVHPEPNFGYTNSVIWLRFRVFSTFEFDRNYLLEFNYANIEDINVYIIGENDGEVVEKKGGFKRPFGEREIRHRKNIFLIPLEEGPSTTIYVKATSRVSLSLGMTLWMPEAHAERDRSDHLFFGFFYGMLAIMAFYNLFLYFSIRDRSYLYYFLYCGSFGLYQMTIDGFALHVPPEFLPWSCLCTAALGIMLLFGANFSRHFLLTPRFSPEMDKALKIYMAVMVLYTLFALVSESHMVTFLSPVVAWLFIALVLPAAIMALRQGHLPTRYYLLAVSGFVAGILLRSLKVAGIIPDSVFSLYGMQVGIIFEMLVLSFALGNRINTLRAEQEQEKAWIRNRISADLHDEVGSNLSSIAVSSQLMRKTDGLGEEEKQQLIEIGDTALSTAGTLRDIVWFINPEHDRFDDMLLKMKDVANNLLRGVTFDFNTSLEADSIVLDPDVRKNVFMIYREALNNIVKHAGAGHVKIEVKSDGKIFRLAISDNGKGFDLGLNGIGEGLNNMRNRAGQIGAQFIIDTGNDNGTTVRLTARITRLRDGAPSKG